MASTPPVTLKAKEPQLSPSVEGCWENCKWRLFYKDLPLAQMQS